MFYLGEDGSGKQLFCSRRIQNSLAKCKAVVFAILLFMKVGFYTQQH